MSADENPWSAPPAPASALLLSRGLFPSSNNADRPATVQSALLLGSAIDAMAIAFIVFSSSTFHLRATFLWQWSKDLLKMIPVPHSGILNGERLVGVLVAESVYLRASVLAELVACGMRIVRKIRK